MRVVKGRIEFLGGDPLITIWMHYIISFSHLISNVTSLTLLMLVIDWPTAFITHCIAKALTTPTSQWAPERWRMSHHRLSPALPFGTRRGLLVF